MSILHALLVGINNYAPKSKVSRLSACVSDINALETILAERYGLAAENSVKLLNEAATRANIMAHFEAIAKKVSKGDKFVFAYSGHGSQESAPSAFWQYAPNKKNETIVCYDSREEGGFDLADKELAVLLYEISKQEVDTVLLMDCCHAGSMSRLTGERKWQSRHEEQADYERDLATYANGYYSRQLETQPTVSLPPARHIALSACHDSERAWENEDGYGAFSAAYQNVLRKGEPISYLALFEAARFAVRAGAEVQHPQLESYGISVHNEFLGNTPLSAPIRVPITVKKGAVYLDMGAVHGLVLQANKPIEVQIYSKNSKEVVANAVVKRVLIQDSVLEISGDSSAINPDLPYEAMLLYYAPKPLPIYLEASPNHKNAFNQIAQQHYDGLMKLAPYIWVDAPEKADYTLRLSDDLYGLYWQNNSLLHGFSFAHHNGKDDIEKYFDRTISLLFDIDSISKWEVTKSIHNPNTRINSDEIEFCLDLIDRDSLQTSQTYSDSTIQLLYQNVGNAFDAELDGIDYQLKVRNNSQKPLYITLLQLGFDFGISCQTGSELLLNPHSDWVILAQNKYAYIPDNFDINSDIFKIFAATTPINHAMHAMSQRPIRIGTIENKQPNYRAVGERTAADWTCKSIQLTLLRKNARIGSQNNVASVNNVLHIAGHSKFKANLSSIDISKKSRALSDIENTSPHLQYSQLEQYAPLSCLQISDIQNDTNLQEEPLQLHFDDSSLLENEYILAVAYNEDNQPIILNAPEKNAAGQAILHIHQLPEPNENQKARTRSLGKAIKLYFFKLIGKKREDLLQLCWADYTQPKALRQKEGLKERVDKAKNILILIHGIIGDTEGMMQALRFATQPNPDKTTFDLVITVDYESLNTPIEETAQKLKTALHELGIQANDDKNVTILAHSMGGLISRCLIEQLKGYEFVDKLIMAGTPNGGSAFGKIEQYRSLFSTVLTYSLGFIGWATAAIGTTLTALTGVGQLTKTLGQMNIGSDFIERLNSNFSCPAIPYIIIAGDINHPDFGKAQGGFFAQLSQKVLHSVGNLANQKEPNDIAVSVDSITCLSKYQKCPDGSTSPLLVFPVIPCTHLNYFDDPDSLQILQKIF